MYSVRSLSPASSLTCGNPRGSSTRGAEPRELGSFYGVRSRLVVLPGPSRDTPGESITQISAFGKLPWKRVRRHYEYENTLKYAKTCENT